MIGYAVPSERVDNPATYPSPLLWKNGQTGQGSGFPEVNIVNKRLYKIGHFEYEDFTDFPLLATNTSGTTKGWNYFLSNGGLIADAAIANVNAATFSSDGDNEAAIIAKCMASVRITKGSGRPVYFETRVQFSTVADSKNGAFFGLFEPITPTATSHIGDDGNPVDANFIGFWRPETDGDDIVFTYKRNGQARQDTTIMLTTLAAATWVKLGFAFDGNQTLKVYVDGQEVTAARLTASALTAVTFPSLINLAPAIVGAKNATGTTPGSNTVNWLAFGYVNNPADGFKTAPVPGTPPPP